MKGLCVPDFLGGRRGAVVLGTLAVGAALLAMMRGGGPLPSQAQPAGSTTASTADRFAGLPSEITLQATIRDFKAKPEGGHPDFQAFGNSVERVGLLRNTLDSDGKPVLSSVAGTGDVTKDFKDASGRTIPPLIFAMTRDTQASGLRFNDGRKTDFRDVAGTVTPRTAGQITSAASFNQWYRDVAGVNVSKSVPLTLKRQAGTSTYVMDSNVDEPWKSRGGFFPINGEGYGNYSSTRKNFHFTTEVTAEFTYAAGTNQIFQFSGDDDVWVFIDGRLVIDLGGLHPRREQYLELDRLPFLENGRVYTMKMFHAERATDQSNFRVVTSIQFRKVDPPPVAGLSD